MNPDDRFARGPQEAPAPGRLHVEVAHEESDCAVVFVRGELDRNTVPVLAGHLRATVDVGGGDRAVVVNLAGTTFIDVGGMCCLVEAAVWASERGSRLFLAGCSTQLLRLMNLTNAFGEMNVIPSGRL
jgi:anti-anti-sigma factor